MTWGRGRPNMKKRGMQKFYTCNHADGVWCWALGESVGMNTYTMRVYCAKCKKYVKKEERVRNDDVDGGY